MMIRQLPRSLHASLGSRLLRSASTTVQSTNLKNHQNSSFQYDESTILENNLKWQGRNLKINVLDPSEDSKKIFQNEAELYGENPRVSVLMEMNDRVGVLHDVLKYFWKYDVNVSVHRVTLFVFSSNS
jgi:hypothetical protein